jgi:hypothetical protein
MTEQKELIGAFALACYTVLTRPGYSATIDQVWLLLRLLHLQPPPSGQGFAEGYVGIWGLKRAPGSYDGICLRI